MTEVQPGQQYIGVVCHKCGKPIPIFKNYGDTVAVRDTGHLEVQCPRSDCAHLDRYQANELHKMTVHQKH